MSLPNPKAKATAASNYAAVKDQIERDRMTPWSSAPAMKIGKFVVNPLSLRSLVDLEISKNEIVTGGGILPGSIGAFIWRHHKDFPDVKEGEVFLKEFAEIKDMQALADGCMKHVKAAFAETPEGSSFGGTRRNDSMPAVPSISFYCDEYAAAYGLNPLDVADIDLRVVFQQIRSIRLRHHRQGIGGEYTYLEPKALREAAGQLLQSHG